MACNLTADHLRSLGWRRSGVLLLAQTSGCSLLPKLHLSVIVPMSKGQSHENRKTRRMTKKKGSMTTAGNEGAFSSQHITAGHCHVCGAERMLDARYDAIFCPRCVTWLEPACADPGCEFCADRPRLPQVGKK